MLDSRQGIFLISKALWRDPTIASDDLDKEFYIVDEELVKFFGSREGVPNEFAFEFHEPSPIQWPPIAAKTHVLDSTQPPLRFTNPLDINPTCLILYVRAKIFVFLFSRQLDTQCAIFGTNGTPAYCRSASRTRWNYRSFACSVTGNDRQQYTYRQVDILLSSETTRPKARCRFEKKKKRKRVFPKSIHTRSTPPLNLVVQVLLSLNYFNHYCIIAIVLAFVLSKKLFFLRNFVYPHKICTLTWSSLTESLIATQRRGMRTRRRRSSRASP